MLIGVLIVVTASCAGFWNETTSGAERSCRVAETYCSSLEQFEFLNLGSLFEEERHLPVSGVLKSTQELVTPSSGIAWTCRVASVNAARCGFDVKVTLKTVSDDDKEVTVLRTIYLTEEAAILWDPVFIAHPGIGVPGILRQLGSEDAMVRTAGVNGARKLGLPLKDYDAAAPADLREAELLKLQEWWQSSNGALDTGCPLSAADRAFLDKVNQ